MDRAILAHKEAAVGELVDRIAADLGQQTFDLVDHWEDLLAIGFACPSDHDVLVYVQILIDDEGELLTSENRYYYECETPDSTEEMGYRVTASGNDATYEQVARAIAQHLQAPTP